MAREEQGMKKIITISGMIFICLIVVGGIVFTGLYYYASRLDMDAKAYIDKIIPIITISWSSEELINHASPEFLEEMPPEKIELLFDILSKHIGPLEEYKGANGKIEISISSEGKLITIGDYMAEAVFKNGPAKIRIQLIRRNDEWKIFGFLVKVKVKL